MSGKYLAARQAFGDGSLSWTRDRIVVQLVSAKYIFDENDQDADAVAGKLGDRIELMGKSTTDGWMKASRLIFREVSGVDPAVAVIFHRQVISGKSKPNTLIAYIDAITGFPMTPNNGDIEINIPAPGIFRI